MDSERVRVSESQSRNYCPRTQRRGTLLHLAMPSTLRHVVLGAFTEEATAAQKDAMLEALRRMPAQIPEIASLVCGLDAGLSPGNHGFAVTVDFDGVEAYQVYATHAAHVAVITGFIKPILKPGSRTAVQFPLAAL